MVRSCTLQFINFDLEKQNFYLLFLGSVRVRSLSESVVGESMNFQLFKFLENMKFEEAYRYFGFYRKLMKEIAYFCRTEFL